MPMLISEPISLPEPDGGAADETNTFKLTETTVSSAYTNTKDVNEELFLIFDIFYFDLNTNP